MKYEKEYQEVAHDYLCKDEEYYNLRARVVFEDYFRKNFKSIQGSFDQKRKKIIEWGVGLGQNVYILNRFGIDVVGYDTSKFAVDFCKKKGLNASNKLIGKYDVIFCRHVLEHLLNPYDTLKEMCSHLKQGGILDLIIPYERHKRVPLKPDHNGHLWGWNFQCINNLLGELGFKVIKNEVLIQGEGYHKLKFVYDWWPFDFGGVWAYNLATKLVGWIRGCRELRIVGIKK